MLQRRLARILVQPVRVSTRGSGAVPRPLDPTSLTTDVTEGELQKVILQTMFLTMLKIC
jgi:hypothetical protein